ncbi:ProQ/FINO family protein [Methylosinus sp. PW1]|uniref:ProQ/FINO family protein n=1 Tax=Methylosinus sp. PW1 TaxID=107636 RepID=UPI000691E541|nr:ProQ/FINO family protein [Methylosinus sp. PW1]
MPDSVEFPPGAVADRRERRLALHARYVRQILCERFPLAFRGRGASKPPLKIGIGRDVQLAMPELPPVALVAALRDYASGPTYCRNLTASAQRIGLDGEPAGQVSETEAKQAELRMAVFRKKVAVSGSPAQEKGEAI